MKKIISNLVIAFVLSLSVTALSGFTKIYYQDDISCKSTVAISSNYEWREYILVGDQWYLIIHYDDGSIGAFPIAQPTVD